MLGEDANISKEPSDTSPTDPDLSVKEIAAALGFANQSHFGSFMRKETGSSPVAFRNDSYKRRH
jgi:AraC-like DNA-binding protein